jgi:hypothetical protein
MAISSLSNFSIPVAGANQALLMPKLKYRFRIIFTNFGSNKGAITELTKQVAEAARPSVKFADQKIELYNSVIHYAGKPAWDPISVKLRDDVTNSVTKLVGEQNQKQFDFFEQSSAATAGDYKFTMRIEMLDGGNGGASIQVLEAWECYGCYLVSTNYQDLKYSDQGAAMIDLSIQFDNCAQFDFGDEAGTKEIGVGAQASSQPRATAGGGTVVASPKN